MARQRTICASAINVRIHPHPAGRYRDLLKAAFALKRAIKSRGDQRLLISALDARGEKVIKGIVARFTEIDMDLPWFNAEKFDAADDDELQQINIPENLKPNYTPFFFEFHLESHLFVFEQYGTSGSLSPNQVAKYLTKLFSNPKITKEFGRVNVDMVSDIDALERIIKLERLKRLQIVIHRPNSDDLGGLDEDIEARLLAQNARDIEISLDAVPGQSLEPDALTTNLAKIALLNGKVKSAGVDEGGFVQRSSDAHPKIEKHSYDPDGISSRQAFSRAARSLVNAVAKMRL